MGITGLLPFIEKASRRANVSEFSGCTVAIDSYCWLHKGAFACADRLVRGEETDIHIKYCMKYVSMLLSRNIKPILVFDGRHLPAKAMTEAKRRESRDISKKRSAELLSLGQVEEARSYMRRSVDITHAMALQLIKECRNRNVDCIVAPYEADAQLAYLNIKNIAHLVITEDSDLILFGCSKVLFKMDLEGCGTLVDTAKLPLAMKCPIERYNFDKFRQMCIMSGCDYLPSLPGIGLAKARQFVNATQDPNFANALKKLPSFFNKSNLTVTDEYRENFLKAEATFKHQYVYDPIDRKMLRLCEPDDDDIETALCCNAGELLDPKTAFQLALGNLDPFTLKQMDIWNPDTHVRNTKSNKTNSWKESGISSHPSMWYESYKQYLIESHPWTKKIKKTEPVINIQTRPRAKVVNLVTKYVPETQDQSLSIEALSNMYCRPPAIKRLKTDDSLTELSSQDDISDHDKALLVDNTNLNQPNKSPVLENKERSFLKMAKRSEISNLRKLSNFPRTTIDDNVVESKFFGDNAKTPIKTESCDIDRKVMENKRNPFKVQVNRSLEENSPDFIDNTEAVADVRKQFRNPFKVKVEQDNIELDSLINEIPDTQEVELIGSQKENSLADSVDKESGYFSKERSPIFESSPKRVNGYNNHLTLSEDSVVENTYPLEELVTPVDSQNSFGESQKINLDQWRCKQEISHSQPVKLKLSSLKKSNCRVPGLKRTNSLPSNQPTLLSKFGFQKRPALKK